MRAGKVVGLAMAAVFMMTANPASDVAKGAEAACGRACLEAVVDQYIAALVAGDPTKAPLTKDVRFTENGQELEIGDALWGTASGAPTYRLTFAEPAAGQVGFFAVMEESGAPIILCARLKVEAREISEIETIIARTAGGSGFAQPENLTEPKPIFQKTIPREDRLSRGKLVAIADSYFTGLDTENSGANVPFDEDCQRLENGAVTANNPNAKPGTMQALGCNAQFDTGFSVIVTDIRERRYPIVDRERGLVFAFAFFDHNGTVEEYGRPGGGTSEVSETFRRPLTLMIGELFKIDADGEIRQIEAVLTTVPYGMPSGWRE